MLTPLPRGPFLQLGGFSKGYESVLPTSVSERASLSLPGHTFEFLEKPEYYFDAFHLNAKGRHKFTAVPGTPRSFASCVITGAPGRDCTPGRRVLAYRVQKLRIPHPDWYREDFRALLELLRAGKIHPVVAERLPLSDARHAHELLERTAAKGKLVLVP